MLTVDEFKKRITKVNSPDWMSVVIDANNANQFYIVANGGMGNTISMPVEKFPAEIKACIISMLNSGELVINENKSFLLEINVLVHYLLQPPVQNEGS